MNPKEADSISTNDMVQNAASSQPITDELEQARFVEAIRAGEQAIAEGRTVLASEAFTAIRAACAPNAGPSYQELTEPDA